MDVLAWVAVPERVLTILLPPLSRKTLQRALWVNVWNRTSSITNGFETHAFVVHSAGHEFLNLWAFIGQGTFGGTVLVVEFHVSGIIREEWVAALLTCGQLIEVWVCDSFCHGKLAVLGEAQEVQVCRCTEDFAGVLEFCLQFVHKTEGCSGQEYDRKK